MKATNITARFMISAVDIVKRATLIEKAAAKVLSLNRTQGVSDKRYEAALQALDNALSIPKVKKK